MLKQIPGYSLSNPLLKALARANGSPSGVVELRPGIYKINHFGSSNLLSGWDHTPSFPEQGNGIDPNRSCYGVCDNIEQIIQRYPELEGPGRQFAVTVTEVTKARQHPDGGWRWHKWGTYIGNKNPQCEYLFDEGPEIDSVLVFHIFEYVPWE